MRLFFTIIFLGIFLILNAQQRVFTKLSDDHLIGPNKKDQNALTEKSLQVVWSDDVSNAANWTFTNQSTNAANNWYILNTPSSIPISALTPFASSTASNGFLMISSDSIMSGTSNNDGDSIYAYATIAQPIDLTNYHHVLLEFSHNYRFYYDTRIVEISSDNGLTWDTAFVFTDEFYTYNSQTNSQNPTNSSIDISNLAGGSSQVLICRQ